MICLIAEFSVAHVILSLFVVSVPLKLNFTKTEVRI